MELDANGSISTLIKFIPNKNIVAPSWQKSRQK